MAVVDGATDVELHKAFSLFRSLVVSVRALLSEDLFFLSIRPSPVLMSGQLDEVVAGSQQSASSASGVARRVFAMDLLRVVLRPLAGCEPFGYSLRK